MKQIRTEKRFVRTTVASVLCAVAAVLYLFSVYAYFSTRAIVYTSNGSQHAQLGMSLDLLFDQLNSDETLDQVATSTDIGTGVNFNPDADWGSAANPYIISDIRHLQNLSALQEIGYFDELYIQSNYDNGSYNGNGNIPYFLICEPDGTPVTIDGTDVTFSPIGTDTYPFYGFVGGSFADGDTEVNGQTSDTSVVYNLTVQTNTDVIDVGLFGTIGYLGEEPESKVGNFTAQVSTVQDLLLYDVKIKVNQPSLIDSVVDLLENHLFLYKMVGEDSIDSVPHENHHIGILAGHVEYANVNFISVYYSDDSVVAIDLAHTGTTYNNETSNYLSNTGIIGFLYNMNPEISEAGVAAGTGGSSDTISINSSIGTGGGLASGNGRGYVTASELYDMYNPNNNDGDLRLMDAVDENGEQLVSRYYRERLLGIFGAQPQATDYYYFYDGVFTFGLSSANTSGSPNQDKIENTWNNDGDVADTFTVGENNDAKWKKNTTKGNNAVVAYVKDIKNEGELQAAITNNKQIYIGYDDGTEVSLMSLYDSEAGSSGWLSSFADNKYKTKAFTRSWVTDSEAVNSIAETLQYAVDNGESIDGMLPFGTDNDANQYLINNIDSYKIITLGSGDDLQKIKELYPITVSKVSDPGKYNLENNGNYLSIVVQRTWLFIYIYSASIWAGSEKPNGNNYGWDKGASIVFDDTGSATISFTYTNRNWGDNANKTRYVSYESEYFQGRDNENSTTKLRLYTVEGTSNLNFGRITYDPVDELNSTKYNADQVLLWPEVTYAGANGRTADKATYSLRYLQNELTNEEVNVLDNYLTAADGWKNRQGMPLRYLDLHKKFSMEKSASWGATLSILGGNFSVGDGTIVAPVGTLGVEANIPLGTIAFRINKTAPVDQPNKISVIVSVPVCEFYNGEDDAGNFYTTGLNYFGLWHVTANGEAIVSTFNSNNAIEKFELPRSNPYDPSSTAGASDYILIKNADGSTSRCYLNGNRVLVAYQFEVIEEGVYLLGATNGPMEIVYFSADNTASSGRDGSTGAKLGSIDFVYDHNSRVITVKEETPDTVVNPNSNGEDYDYYYNSLCLLYTDNGAMENSSFVDVNNAQIKVRRYIQDSGGDETAHMNMRASGEDEDYIKLEPYSVLADIVD